MFARGDQDPRASGATSRTDRTSGRCWRPAPAPDNRANGPTARPALGIDQRVGSTLADLIFTVYLEGALHENLIERRRGQSVHLQHGSGTWPASLHYKRERNVRARSGFGSQRQTLE